MKPNIVLLLTDDQNERSLGLVPGVEEAIGAAGGRGPTNFLVEHWAEGGVPTYRGVRSNEGRVYVEYSSGASAGDWELYDIREDPYQLNNRMDEGVTPTYLRERLAALRDCSGGACRSAEEVSKT